MKNNKNEQNVEQKKVVKPRGLEIKLPGMDDFKPIEFFINDVEIQNIYIEELQLFNCSFLYKIFQICKYYNINFNDLIIRQLICIETKGNKNFNLPKLNNSNTKFLGKKCKCILCNREFIAIRNTIKICNSQHYCNCIDLYTGEIYKKEIQKWNNVYYSNNQLNCCYLEGKTYSSKSHQVSANNMNTLYNHTNKMQNMTIEKRQEMIKNQKENGTFWFDNVSYEERCKVNKKIAQNRMLNGTNNLQYIHKIPCNKNCIKYNDCNKKNNDILKNINGLCREISSNNGMKIMFCQKCNKNTLHNGFNCIICNPNSKCGGKVNFIIKNNIKFYKGEPVEEIIKKLDSGEYNVKEFPGFEKRYDKWTYHGKDLLSNEFYELTGLFHTINNIKYYKQIPIDELIKQLDNDKIEIPPGFNKRFGEWYYNQENILTEEIAKLNKSLFEIKDKVEYYYDKSISDYVSWDNYKRKFSLLNTDFKLPEGFEWYTTFRKQDSLDWSNARIAFERNLVENNINWFVYIKFYYDKDNNLKPLVVGKSGSMNMNYEGSDVSFSTDINDGPARKFLKDNNLDWCKTQIAIIKCDNEQEALNKEKEIQLEYNLFGS